MGPVLCYGVGSMTDIGKMMIPLFICLVSLQQFQLQYFGSRFSHSVKQSRRISVFVMFFATFLAAPSMQMITLIEEWECDSHTGQNVSFYKCAKVPDSIIYIQWKNWCDIISGFLGIILPSACCLYMLKFGNRKVNSNDYIDGEGYTSVERKCMNERGHKTLKLLVVFLTCFIPNLSSNLIFMNLAGNIVYLTKIKLRVFHLATQAIFITYCVMNPVLIANKDF